MRLQNKNAMKIVSLDFLTNIYLIPEQQNDAIYASQWQPVFIVLCSFSVLCDYIRNVHNSFKSHFTQNTVITEVEKRSLRMAVRPHPSPESQDVQQSRWTEARGRHP